MTNSDTPPRTDSEFVTEIVQLLRLCDVDYSRAARICRRAAQVFEESDSGPAASAEAVDFMTLLDEP
jgi:hypothetical protein